MKSSDEVQMGFFQHREAESHAFPVSYRDWKKRAKEVLEKGPYGYIAGGAGAGDTMRANREAFQAYRLVPRVCCDISKRDLSIHLFGKTYPAPIFFAPIGVNSIFHPDAERAPAKAAAELGIPYILSTVSSVPMEDIAETMGGAERWFQLYPPKTEQLTKSLLHRAEQAGYSAIVVTVDSTMLGWREADLTNAYLPFLSGHGMGNYFSDPVFLQGLDEKPEHNLKQAVEKALAEGNNTCFTWEKFRFIREHTRLPVLLKGLSSPEDADLAVKQGADGIVVSNHGGRQLDGAVAALDALPRVAERVGKRVPVLMDSGIRRGADVIKALALGASAVLLGRPYIYGLAVAGSRGVRDVVQNLLAETELQLAISGRARIGDIDPSIIMKVR